MFCTAKPFSVTHLHHDVSVVHTTTTHAFVPFTDSITALIETDYKSHWITHLLLHEDLLILYALLVNKGERGAIVFYF